VTVLLELQGLKAGYGRVEVLRGVDLHVNAGEIVALLGSNGAGKSTLNNTVSGLVRATTGRVMFDGSDLTNCPSRQVVQAGLIQVPEGRRIFPNLTVRENLQMVTYGGARLADVEATAYERFPRLGERRKQLAGTMSGGEQQMLAMARGLASNPALLFLDELSMGLAPLVVEELYGIVAQIARSGVSILVIEQFARTVLGVADYAAIMLNGLVRSVGRPADIEDELSAAYLGGQKP
jgi:branched-chain amino acid transport system ATP-binding protein